MREGVAYRCVPDTSIMIPLLETYTIQELDILYRALVDENTNAIYHPQDAIRRMVVFTNRLHVLLTQEGFVCTYPVAPMIGYKQALEVYLSDDQIHLVILDLFSLYSGYKSITSSYPIQELVQQLRDLRTMYIQATHARHELSLLVDQCRGCHYSDEGVEYCGKGLTMTLQCSSYRGIQ